MLGLARRQWMISAGIWLELLAGWSLLQAGHPPQPRCWQGRGLSLEKCPGAPPALGWASSFSKACTGLQAPLNICWGPKGLLRLGPPPPAVPCWLDLGTLSGGRCLGIWLLQQSWGDGQPPWESSHCGGAAPQRDSSAAIAVPLPYASTWQRQESGPKHLFSFTLLLCPS